MRRVLLNDTETQSVTSRTEIHIARTVRAGVRTCRQITGAGFREAECAITSDLSSGLRKKKKTTTQHLKHLDVALRDNNNPAKGGWGRQIMIYVLWPESARGSIACVHGSRAPRRSFTATRGVYVWCKIASSVYNSIWSLWERQANTDWYIAPVSRHGRSNHTKIHLSLRSQMIRLICCEHSYF